MAIMQACSFVGLLANFFTYLVSVVACHGNPTGDQEVAGLTPTGLATFFHHEIFSIVILSLPLIQEGQLPDSCERMCTILVNRLQD